MRVNMAMTRRCALPSLRPNLLVAGIVVAVAPARGAAQQPCRVLSATQVATMLGPGPSAKELRGGLMCNWTAATGARKLQVTVSPVNDEARSLFDDMYASPGKKGLGEVRREPNLGDRAVSLTLPYGVNFEVLKGSHIVALVYANHGVAPTAREHDALRALAQAVVAQL
jgi:hypothetical protein